MSNTESVDRFCCHGLARPDGTAGWKPHLREPVPKVRSDPENRLNVLSFLSLFIRTQRTLQNEAVTIANAEAARLVLAYIVSSEISIPR